MVQTASPDLPASAKNALEDEDLGSLLVWVTAQLITASLHTNVLSHTH